MSRNDRTSPLCDISTEKIDLTQDATLVCFMLVVLLLEQMSELYSQVSTSH